MNDLIARLRAADSALCSEAADTIEMCRVAIDRNVKLADKYNDAADKIVALSAELAEFKKRSLAFSEAVTDAAERLTTMANKFWQLNDRQEVPVSPGLGPSFSTGSIGMNEGKSMTIKYVQLTVSIHGIDAEVDDLGFLKGWIREATKAALLGNMRDSFKYRNENDSDIEVEIEEVAGE